VCGVEVDPARSRVSALVINDRGAGRKIQRVILFLCRTHTAVVRGYVNRLGELSRDGAPEAGR
jgi:hypothetical protein